jgi:hypothetical protein
LALQDFLKRETNTFQVTSNLVQALTWKATIVPFQTIPTLTITPHMEIQIHTLGVLAQNLKIILQGHQATDKVKQSIRDPKEGSITLMGMGIRPMYQNSLGKLICQLESESIKYRIK